MNHKGFTLVELLAMLVVIGILMAITIPNISGILKNNRESIGVEDVNKMVGNAKTKMETGQAKNPPLNGCIVMSLKFIDNNSDFATGVNGGNYDRDESVIVVKKEQLNASTATNTYKYYIRLVEVKGSQTYVIELVDYDTFAKEPENYIGQLTNFTDDKKLKLKENSKDQIKNRINTLQPNLCTSISDVYV